MKIMKIIFKVLKYTFVFIVGLLLIFNLIGIVQKTVLKQEMPMLFEIGTAVVVTGSMEPAIHVDDMIIIHSQSEYQKDDIVTYQSNSYITHRIVEKTQNGYITKGDANNTPDKEIEKNKILGRVVLAIPRAGYVIDFLKSPFGILALCIGLFALIELPELINKKTKRR